MYLTLLGRNRQQIKPYTCQTVTELWSETNQDEEDKKKGGGDGRCYSLIECQLYCHRMSTLLLSI